MSVPGQEDMAGRAVVLRIEPPAASRPLRASIVPSLRSADASGPASSSGLRASLAYGLHIAAAVAMSSRLS